MDFSKGGSGKQERGVRLRRIGYQIPQPLLQHAAGVVRLFIHIRLRPSHCRFALWPSILRCHRVKNRSAFIFRVFVCKNLPGVKEIAIFSIADCFYGSFSAAWWYAYSVFSRVSSLFRTSEKSGRSSSETVLRAAARSVHACEAVLIIPASPRVCISGR